MARSGLLATFEDGFYDAWAPVRPILHHWESEKQPVHIFQVIHRGMETRYMVDEIVFVQARGLYGVGYAVGQATKRMFYPPEVPGEDDGS